MSVRDAAGTLLLMTMLLAGVPTASFAQAEATCRDEPVEAVGSYDRQRSRGISGPILRVAYAPDHTLLVLAAPESQEVCAILPARAELLRRRVDPGTLAPGGYASLTGFRHHSDDGRLWALTLAARIGVRGIELRPD